MTWQLNIKWKVHFSGTPDAARRSDKPAPHFGSDKNPTYEQGDFNADGVVNFKDFLVFINANQRLTA